MPYFTTSDPSRHSGGAQKAEISPKKPRKRRSDRQIVLNKFPSAVCEKSRCGRYRVVFRQIGMPEILGDNPNHAWMLAVRWLQRGLLPSNQSRRKVSRRVGGEAREHIYRSIKTLVEATQVQIVKHSGHSEGHVHQVLQMLCEQQQVERVSGRPYRYRFIGGNRE